jgi:hypothetical protein
MRRGLPPAVQPPTGLRRDADFLPPERGFWSTLFGRGSDGRLYELPPEDQKRIRPVFLRSKRAVRNEQIASARQAARGAAGTSGIVLDDGPGPYRWDGRSEP